MEYKLDKSKGATIVADVHVSASEWDDALNASYEKNKAKFNVPGFRKGHAPRNVVEKAYGSGAFLEGALDEVYYKAYTQVLRENEDVKPVDSPKLEIKNVGENGVDIVLSIPCVPTFELAQYKGLTFTKLLRLRIRTCKTPLTANFCVLPVWWKQTSRLKRTIL